MATQIYDDALFRAQFVAFANTATYPQAVISAQFDVASLYIGNEDWWILNGAALVLAINALTAHLLQLNKNAARGTGATGLKTGATVDKVSVSLQPPPVKTAWQQWLSLTPYGLQLWTLLSIKSAGGFYVGGAFERAGFRKSGGLF